MSDVADPDLVVGPSPPPDHLAPPPRRTGLDTAFGAALPSQPRGAEARGLEQPRTAASAWQVASTLLPYLVMLALMYLTVRQGAPRWTTLALAVPASGFLVRIFVLMHDCVHSSFLPSRRAERILGRLLGVLAFTPFAEWRHAHLLHHATSGDLDRRGIGDIWTLTVAEYLASSRPRRLQYRLARNPLLMLLFGPPFLFLVSQRLPHRGASRERVLSVLYTDAALAAVVGLATLTVGLRTYLLIQAPVLFLAGVWGIWLFYVQHQFEPAYWRRHSEWSATQAASQGASYYALPAVLRWFSANIGFHHVHHLRPRIPNYNLERYLAATPSLQGARPLTLRQSVACARLALWDEPARELVRFDEVGEGSLRELQRAREPI